MVLLPQEQKLSRSVRWNGSGLQVCRYNDYLWYCIFGLEAYLDHARGTIDFFNTLAATIAAGSVYSLWYRLSKQQTFNTLRRGAAAGLALGLAQDGLRYVRGNDLWYLPSSLNHEKKHKEEVMHA